MTAAPATKLVARSRWWDGPALDLLTVAGAKGWLWERDHAGFAGHGVALRIPVALGVVSAVSAVSAGSVAAGAVAAAFEAIDVDDEVGVPGSGPVAMGAFPFYPGELSSLVVPSTVVGRTADGRCWVTTISTETPGTLDAASGLALEPQDPDGFELTSPVPHEEWMALVSRAVSEIDAGRFAKVVLAREVRVAANRPIHVPTVLRRLRSLYPACTTVSAPVPDGQFVAASPELLVSRVGDRVRSHPLAGTIPRSGDPDADKALADGLLASLKDRAEHAWVVRDVEATLAPWCSTLDVPATPSIVSLRNVSHLGTRIEGRLAGPAGPSALDLAAALHPTAAVGGTPRDAALAWLRANERLDRGPYAGPVGWVDSHGDGEWVVGIRSAVISEGTARLFAGVGVVEGSDPAAELAETQFKLQALLAAVVRP